MVSIASKVKPCKSAKGTLLYGYRILIRYPSVPPFPAFHNRVVFAESVPGAWYELVSHQGIQRADLFKRGRIVAQFNRAWPELYQAKRARP